MRFVARPICSLEEYIDFYKHAPDFITGSSSITGGRGRGTRGSPLYLDSKNQVAKHYKLIREFVGGPGFEPGSEISPDKQSSEDSTSNQLSLTLEYRTGDGVGPITNRVFSQLKAGDVASIQDLPDLAQDSQQILLLYADIIKSRGKL